MCDGDALVASYVMKNIMCSTVAYDPASFYGHHEFDLAITTMFGGFSREFYSAYHSLIPQAQGFATRSKLYLLFHYLNHWLAVTMVSCISRSNISRFPPTHTCRNHFGSGYRSQSISIMKDLVK